MDNVIPMVRPEPVSELDSLRIQNQVMVMYLDHFDPDWRKKVSEYMDKALTRVENRA